jgi:hypothetical protein
MKKYQTEKGWEGLKKQNNSKSKITKQETAVSLFFLFVSYYN